MADEIQHKDITEAYRHDPKAHTHDTLYLKRGADDFSSVGAEKASPINADRVLIEDSATGQGLAKKWAQLGNLPGGGGGGADYTIDGGDATSVYTGTATIDCGSATG